MQYGFVFTDPKRSKVVVLTKEGDVEFLATNSKENINKAYCLRDISTMKVLYTALREKNLIEEMDIVDIQQLYGKN
jgi:hypothetical protein|tara:strand:- start:184 stop:411 length:228 start_codon:yes stop_codon:yes gene_type:complete